MTRSLILGITGQDGSYLAEHLLSLGHEVHGLVRRTSHDNKRRIRHVLDKVTLHTGDMHDGASVHRVLWDLLPDEVYNLADQDHVETSRHVPDVNADVTYAAVGRLLESVRRIDPEIRVFQACSATMFGLNRGPQHEETPHDPQSPYAVAKTGAYHLGRYYRRHYGLFVTNGILFNHDSPRRGPDYLLHRIVLGLLRLRRDPVGQRLQLTNLDLRVDVGSAQEFVTYYPKLLALDEPTDACVGTGTAHRIRTMVEAAVSLIWGPEYKPLEEVVEDLGATPAQEPTLQCSFHKLYQLVGDRPRRDSVSVIRELIEHYRSRA